MLTTMTTLSPHPLADGLSAPHAMNFIHTLSHPLRERLARLGHERALRAGDTLITQEEIDPSFYLLTEGELCLQAGAQRIALSPGNIVGAIGFLDHGPGVASVQALGDARVLGFERSRVFAGLSDQPLLLNELITKLVTVARQRSSDFAPVAGQSPSDFVEQLAADALAHRAVRHPYLQALAAGTLPNTEAALADFARHYYGYSSHFPRYLTALISRLENPSHRRALLENLTEESGHYEPDELAELAEHGIASDWIVGVAHPELFRRFRSALGVSDHHPSSEHIEVVCWREMFLSLLTNGSPAEALGALGLGTEGIVQTIYQPFVDAIERLGTLRPEDSVFFPLHTAVDDHHQATLKAIATDFAATPTGREELTKGMHKALALRDSFWDFLHERANMMSCHN